MSNILREKYPSIRTRAEVLADIMSDPKLQETFNSWSSDAHRERFLDMCSGARGVKMLYDSFFKAIFNPDSKPKRLEELLSLLLNEEVKILQALPNEGGRVADENSMIIMDIVIELADGRIANVECQKCGYAFPGNRAACYSADLLLRQYKRAKEKNQTMLFQNVQKTYSIIFIENSTSEFAQFPDQQIHYFKQTSNTGLKLDLLQEYFFIPLDIANQIYENNTVTDCNEELEAWLIFLSNDDPEVIADLTARYPRFEELYQEVYELCKNTEQVMNMFSEELSILEKNTVAFMLQEEKARVKELQDCIADMDATIADKDATIADLDATIADMDATIADMDAAIADKDATIADKDATIAEMKQLIAQLKASQQNQD